MKHRNPNTTSETNKSNDNFKRKKRKDKRRSEIDPIGSILDRRRGFLVFLNAEDSLHLLSLIVRLRKEKGQETDLDLDSDLEFWL